MDLAQQQRPDHVGHVRGTRSGPLAGRVVALVHPAWHSCGSHQVFRSQARAYRALGAQVWAIALSDVPAGPRSRQGLDYFDHTEDLIADRRQWLAMTPRAVFDPQFGRALLGFLRGDRASMRIAVAARTPVRSGVDGLAGVDLIHCNHFFCMPVARRIASLSNAPIILESHDIQARQYRLANESSWTLPPSIPYEHMLAIELEWMAKADLIVHLNHAEALCFADLLPLKTQALLYPAVARVDRTSKGRDFLVIAAANHANGESVEWLLRSVAPLAPEIPFRIVGSVKEELRRRAPTLLKQYASLFTERVEDIKSAYDNAAAVVLPTTAGHGISIKTIEALSSGAPIVATPHAFRGMNVDFDDLSNVRIAGDAESFAAALRATLDDTQRNVASPVEPAHPLYERLFSAEAYEAGLAALAIPLLRDQT